MQNVQKGRSAVGRVLMTTGVEERIWNYVRELVSALDAFGVAVTLATFGGSLDAEQRAQARHWQNAEIFESHFKPEWEDDSLQHREAAGQWLLNLEVMTLPDLIHLNGYVHAALPWNAPILLVGHDCPHARCPAGMKSKRRQWERYRKAVIRGLLSANCVTAPTKAILAALKSHYGEFNAAAPMPGERGRAPDKGGRKKASERLARQYLNVYSRIVREFRGSFIPPDLPLDSAPDPLGDAVNQVTSFA